MEKGKEVADARAVLFKRQYGVKPAAFEKMLSILQKEYKALHQKGGNPPKLTDDDKLYITLKYLREYRTMDSIAAEYGACKGTRSACPSNGWKTPWFRTVPSPCPGKKFSKESRMQFSMSG
jgi:hypothetical protein